MFTGTVTFRAPIKGNGLTFPLREFNPGEAGVDKVEIEGRNGDEILCTVHLASVATREAGIDLAKKVNTAILNRISFLYDIAIENDKITGTQLIPLNPPSGAHLHPDTGDYVMVGEAARLVLGVPAESLKTELEQPSLPGEDYYGLLRSARQSMSPVEEFVHVYNLLMMLCSNNDRFADVEAFIFSKEPTVQHTPSSRYASDRETVYTRLRNEMNHTRTLGDLDRTKAEIVQHLPGLIALTKQAIENP
jgi:hypothetical protein